MPFSNLNSRQVNATTTPTGGDGGAGGGGKCATVTMMLAERISRNNWSVDDEHFFETNTMNVWQTLEFLSGITLRKRYHYEGYNDTENVVRMLTPSWRRDSFVEKSANGPDEGGKFATSERNDGGPTGSGGGRGGGAAGGPEASGQEAGRRGGGDQDQGQRGPGQRQAKAGRRRKKRRTRRRPVEQEPEQDSEYALSPLDYADLVKCSFNLPRISARLERLMGTNVVRLTDRKYMKELRLRIEEDYRVQLQKRITSRELKEVERERILIIEGKSEIIPEELSDDPIFVVNKKVSLEIKKQRAKLKTNRERNSERLKLQGVKWERERLEHEEEERGRLEELRERQREQKEMEERYREEDAERGMDLLRIDNEDWRTCEQKLKEFLEQERTKMKERANRKPTPFTSDPNDIQNIVRARMKFRETEQRIRQELEDKMKEDKSYSVTKDFRAKSAASKVSKILATDFPTASISSERKSSPHDRLSQDLVAEEDAKEEMLRKKFSDDTSDVSSGPELVEQGSSISESKRRHFAQLEEEMEEDVQKGLLISEEQYQHLRYEEEKIMQLRQARDIRELYQLAEEIIIGDQVPEELVEEQVAEEEQEEAPPDPDSDDE